MQLNASGPVPELSEIAERVFSTPAPQFPQSGHFQFGIQRVIGDKVSWSQEK